MTYRKLNPFPCVTCGAPHGKQGNGRYCPACLVLSRRQSFAVSKILWQADGRCISCGKARGATGTIRHCRICADKRAEYARNRRARQSGVLA
jgi:hypothetical protein